MDKKFFGTAAVVAMTLTFAGSSYAATQLVLGTDAIYAAGGNVTAASLGGTTPGPINVTGQASVTFGPATGTVSLCAGCGLFNANGVVQSGANVASSNNNGIGNISGVSTTPGVAYLTAVFINGTAGATTQPTPIGGLVTAGFIAALNQVFVIGGGTITVNVPTNATALYFGISDACSYTGAPSCYADNTGSFTETYQVNAPVVNTTPVPPSIWLTLIGLACGAMYLGFNGLRANSRA
jgi:hypothetical protein